MTDVTDLVSVVVPVYGVEDYLDRCVTSILGQTYRELEVILVDDGSPDRCGEMCDEYAQLDPRVKVIHKPNGGIASARNAGLDFATGDFVAFVDSDDWLHPELIQRLREVIATTGAGIAVCQFAKPPAETIPESPVMGRPWVLTRDQAIAELVGAQHILLTVPWAKLIEWKAVDTLRFPEDRLHEDEYFGYRAILATPHTAFIQDPLYYYWQRTDGFMGSGPSVQKARDMVDAFAERAAAIDALGLTETATAAYAQVFRKQLQFYRLLDPGTDAARRRALLTEMRALERDLRGRHPSRGFAVFMRLFVTAPSIGDRAYSGYRAVASLLPGLRRIPGAIRRLSSVATRTDRTNAPGESQDTTKPAL